MRALPSVVCFFLAACGAHTPTPDHAETAPLLSLERIETILDTTTNGSPVLSPDGTHVLYVSSRGDAQLFLGDVAHPEAPPFALVTGEERVGSAAFTPDGTAVLYRSDSGADEVFHVYRVGLDGSGRIDLTPGPGFWRDHPLLPRDRPHTMVYSQRTSTDYASSVVVASSVTPAETPHIVYTDPAPAAVVDVSADGSRALLLREAASGKELVEIDLATGTARQLVPAPGEIAMIQAAAYTPDGARVYVARDRGPDAYTLFLLDLATGATLAEHTPPGTASISAVVPSPTGDRVAVRVDSGSHSSVRMLDATTLAPRFDVASPLGTVTLGTTTEIVLPMAAGTWQDDGSHFVLTVSAPSVPDDVFLGDAATGALSPLVGGASSGPVVAFEGAVDEVIAFDGHAIPVHLYLPADREPGRRLPTIVFFHGGPDQHSYLSWGRFISVLGAAGFAVVEPNVRGSSGFGRAWETADDMERRVDVLRDVESVNQWLRSQPWVDPDRLVIEGASYGGYLVLLVLTREHTLWRAGIDLCGPSDLIGFVGTEPNGRYRAEFGVPAENVELFHDLSPIHHAAAISTPLFIYQGENDPRVNRGESDRMVAALRERGLPVEYMVGANEGHTLDRRENQIEYLTRVLAFLREALAL